MQQKQKRSLASLWHTFVHLKGNARAALWTQPLWAVPNNLFVPFASVYMRELGLSPGKIGGVMTVLLLSQFFWSLFSGFLTDKLGRRTCTLLFDMVAWSIPTLLWTFARGYSWFIVAAFLNGAWRVTDNSWSLLWVEDSKEETLVSLYSISYIAGLLAGFLAPLASLFVKQYSLVPTVRGIYAFAFICMTTKSVLLYLLSRETKVGQQQKQHWKGKGIGAYFKKSFYIFIQLIKSPRVLMVIGLLTVFTASQNITKDFWPILVTEKIGLGEEQLSLFFTAKSIAMLVMYLFVVPNIRVDRFLKPMIIGFFTAMLAQVFVLFAGSRAGAGTAELTVMVVLSVMAEGISVALLQPLVNSLMMTNADKQERARVVGLLLAVCLLITSPFGVIGGSLSAANKSYPIVLNALLIAVGFVLALALAKIMAREAKNW